MRILSLRFLILSLVVFFAVTMSVSSASSRLSATKNGVVIYLGLLPAEMLDGVDARSMHGGVPQGVYRYHLSVALFDEKTGERIKGAEIRVSLHSSNLKKITDEKKLEAMLMGNKVLYGNYFPVNTTGGPYVIKVSIEFKNNAYKNFDINIDYPFAYI